MPWGALGETAALPCSAAQWRAARSRPTEPALHPAAPSPQVALVSLSGSRSASTRGQPHVAHATSLSWRRSSTEPPPAHLAAGKVKALAHLPWGDHACPLAVPVAVVRPRLLSHGRRSQRRHPILPAPQPGALVQRRLVAVLLPVPAKAVRGAVHGLRRAALEALHALDHRRALRADAGNQVRTRRGGGRVGMLGVLACLEMDTAGGRVLLAGQKAVGWRPFARHFDRLPARGPTGPASTGSRSHPSSPRALHGPRGSPRHVGHIHRPRGPHARGCGQVHAQGPQKKHQCFDAPERAARRPSP